jgi:hypothetical protein
LTLVVGVTADGRLGIDAEAGNQTQFTLRGTTGEATFWLPAENRVVVGPADRILDAIVGLELDAGRLLALLSGCVASDRTLEGAVRLGQVVRVTTPDAVVYLEQDEERWLPRAGEFGELIVEYTEWEGQWPGRILVRTAEGQSPAVDLALTVTERAIDRQFPSEAFRVAVPAGAVPARVEDLRLIGSD